MIGLECKLARYSLKSLIPHTTARHSFSMIVQQRVEHKNYRYKISFFTRQRNGENCLFKTSQRSKCKRRNNLEVKEGIIWKLKCCLYGLNDAARQFYQSVIDCLKNVGCG